MRPEITPQESPSILRHAKTPGTHEILIRIRKKFLEALNVAEDATTKLSDDEFISWTQLWGTNNPQYAITVLQKYVPDARLEEFQAAA